MPISSNSTITNTFVPNFRLTNLRDGDLLIYSNVHNAFLNDDGTNFNIMIDGSSITDFTVGKNHLTSSENGLGTAGQVLTVGSNGELLWTTLSSNGTPLHLNDIVDVNTTGVMLDSILRYSGSEWVIGDHSVSSMTDVELTSPVDGQMLRYDSASAKWVNYTMTMGDLGDVILPQTVATGSVLNWDGLAWSVIHLNDLSFTFESLSDTEFTNLTTGQFVKFDGTDWVNSDINYNTDIANIPDLSIFAESSNLALVASTGDYNNLSNLPVLFNGSYNSLTDVPLEFRPEAHTHAISEITDISLLSIPEELEDLTDVVFTTLGSGQVLSWNGVIWTNADLPAYSLATLPDVGLTNPVDGKFLKFDGTTWTDATISAADIPDLTSSLLGMNRSYLFADLADSGTESDGYMKWSTDEVTYHSNIPVGDIVGLATVATSGNYSELSGKPTVMPPTAHTHAISDITDINIQSPSDGEVLIYDPTMTRWENGILSLVNTDLGAGTSDTDFVSWNTSSGLWEASSININDLADVNITPAVDLFGIPIPAMGGQVLMFNGTEWVNGTVSYADLTGTQPNALPHDHHAVDIVDFDSSVIALNNSLTFAMLSDTGTETDGIMKWSGGSVAYVPAIPANEVSGLSTVATTGSYNDLSDRPTINSGVNNFVDLNDTDMTPVGDGWLRWNTHGTIIGYESDIDASDVVGLSVVATTGSYSDLGNRPILAPIATTGQWTDIVDPRPEWATIENKPSTFAPESHQHAIAEITSLQTTLDDKIESDVTSLPSLKVDYTTQVENKPATITNGMFSLHDLNDTANDSQSSRASKYLRWSPDGLEVDYQQYIDVGVITGLSTVGVSGDFNDLLNIPPSIGQTPVIDYGDLTNSPDLSVYALTTDLSTVGISNNYNDLDNKPVLFDKNYSSLLGVPTTFTPEAHTHTAADISGIVVSLDLNDLNNVNALPTNNGDVLSWDSINTTWIARKGTTLTGMVDVDDAPLPNGYLRWNHSGTEVLFEENIAASNVSGLATIATSGHILDATDLIVTTLQAGDGIIWDGNYWRNSPVTGGSGGATSLGALTDVSLSSSVNGQVLTYNGTSWENRDASSIVIGTRLQNSANTAYVDTNFISNEVSIHGPNGVNISSATGDVTLNTISSGNIVLEGQIWPSTDGTTGQILTTNGSGTLSWSDAAAPSIPLLDLTDVTPTSYTGLDGYALTVNSAETGVEFTQLPNVPVNIDDLTDVSVTSATDGQQLVYQSGSWVNQTVGLVAGINGLSDVDTATSAPNDDEVLSWSSTEWVPREIQEIPSGGTTGQILAKSADTDYLVEWADPSVTSTAMNDLSDVDTVSSAPDNLDILGWNSTTSRWVPMDSAVPAGGTQDQVLTKSSGTDYDYAWVDAQSTVSVIDDLSDVDTTTTAPTDGDVMTWSSTNSRWEPAAATGGATLPTGGTAGQVLSTTDGTNANLSWIDNPQNTGTEWIRIDYNADYQLTDVATNLSTTSDGIGTITITQNDSSTLLLSVGFDAKYTNPPVSILFYGYDGINSRYIPINTSAVYDNAVDIHPNGGTLFGGFNTMTTNIKVDESETRAVHSSGFPPTTTHAYVVWKF